MNWQGVITMLAVTGVLWGGFIAALLTAIRGERRRSRSNHRSGDGSTPSDSQPNSTEVR